MLCYGLFLIVLFYSTFSIIRRSKISLEKNELTYHVVLYMLFGLTGEEVVNTGWKLFFNSPLWEYKLYPIHNGNVSLFFFQIWGIFGFYTYIRNKAFPSINDLKLSYITLLSGIEAIFIELIVNVPYYYLFNDYIFYYYPANLGFFSHFSCLEVIPFYIAISITTRRLINAQRTSEFKHLKTTISFYLMIIIACIIK